MLNPYKEAFRKIIVPPELITKTALKVRWKLNKANKSVRVLPYIRFGGIVAACIALVLLLPAIIQSVTNKTGIFITKLDAGNHTSQVELTDGFLSFMQESGGLKFNPPLQLSSPEIHKEEWKTERYMEYLGARVEPGYLPEGMVVEHESAVVYVSADGGIHRDCYTMRFTSDDGALEISISKGKLPPQCDTKRGEDSHIGNKSLAVGVSKDNNTYWAQFMLDDAGVYIETTNISQEEFIKTLHSFFK